jgi:hypothetical protein
LKQLIFLHVTHATQQQFHSIEQLLPAFLSLGCAPFARSNISAAIILISFETHVQRFLISERCARSVLQLLKQAPIESCLGCFYLICGAAEREFNFQPHDRASSGPFASILKFELQLLNV